VEDLGIRFDGLVAHLRRELPHKLDHVVFADADPEKTADTIGAFKYRNAGQVCVSPTRFIVQENVYEKLRDGFAERAALPVGCVHPLPKGLDPVTAALAEPAACCLSGLEMFRMPPGATVVVMGGGIMGLLTLALARRRGAARLILSDPLEERREIARKLGARVVVDPTRESLPERVMALTSGQGAEVVCEAVGKPELVAEAFTMVRPTGVLQLVGVNPKGSRPPIDLFDLHFREVRIHGAYGRGTAFRRALALLPRLGVKRLIGAKFPLARIEEAFAHAAAGRGAKTVITPGA